MAIYKTGTASMDANGVITGKGTAWMTALSLIRVGATIVFLSGDAPVFATIAAIISDTEMRASEKPEADVADGTYTILLHDSLTVDGLAQDIAETLKYYQSTETQVSQVVDLLKDVDVNQLISLDRSMKETAQRVEDSEETIKGYADEAELRAANAAQSVLDAAAQVDLAKVEVTNAAEQVNLAKDEVANAKAQADLAAGSVVDAAAEVQKAADQVALAQQAVTDAGAQVDLASGFADDAKAQSDRAEQLANSVDPDQLLKKDQNLADVASKSDSLQNLLDGKPLPLAAPAVNPNDAPTFQQLKSISQTESSSFGVMNSYAAGQPANSLLEGGRVQSEIRVNGAVSAKVALVAKQRVGGEAWAAIEITDASGAQQTVKTIGIPNIDGSTILTDKSGQSPVAWVSFNGADGSIFGSHNVSSVSKSSGGLYEINFIRNTQDTKYAVVASAYQAASQTSSTVVSETGARAVNKTTVKVMRADSAVGVENAAIISVIVMGVLA